MSGKGDKQIKAQVSWQTYSDNWDNAFSRTFKRKIDKVLKSDAKKVIKEINNNERKGNMDKVFGTSTCELIAEQLLEEDKAVCGRIEKAATVELIESRIKKDIEDTIYSCIKKAADTQKQ